MRSIKYIINHKLLKISFELQTRSSKIFAIAQSDFTTLCSNWKIVKLQWQKQLESSAASATFFFKFPAKNVFLILIFSYLIFLFQTGSSKIPIIAQSGFTTLCPNNRKIVKWQKQLECSAAAAHFFQISRQKYVLNSNIFLLNFSLAGRKLKNLRYCAERFHYVVPEQQKNR